MATELAEELSGGAVRQAEAERRNCFPEGAVGERRRLPKILCGFAVRSVEKIAARVYNVGVCERE